MGPARDQGLLEVKEIVEKGTDKEQYDPKQPEEERRELRIKYRQLTEEANGKKNTHTRTHPHPLFHFND